jgi:hypothetical protein
MNNERFPNKKVLSVVSSYFPTTCGKYDDGIEGVENERDITFFNPLGVSCANYFSRII